MRALIVFALIFALAAIALMLRAPWGNVPEIPSDYSADPPESAIGVTVPATIAADPAIPADETQRQDVTAPELSAAERSAAEQDLLAALMALSIAVVDADGKPCTDVPVCVAYQRDQSYRTAWYGKTSTPKGTVGVPASSLKSLAKANSAVCAIDLPMAQRPFLEFDPKAPPEDPIVLELPATGYVQVDLVSNDPTRLEGAEVWLSKAGDSVSESPGRTWVKRTVTNGRIVFDRVGLGMTLSIKASLEGENRTVRQSVTGPVGRGETVFVTLSMRATKPILVARLVDEKGNLMRETRVSVRMEAKRDGSSSSSMFSAKTDRHGMLRLELADDLGKRTRRKLRISVSDTAIACIVKVPEVLIVGDNDLGTLTLAPPPLILSGVVVNNAGKTIANARIGIQHKRYYGATPEHGFTWNSAKLRQAKTDEHGKFTVHGIVESNELSVTIEHIDYLPITNREFAVGANGIQFELNSAGDVTGNFIYSGGSLAGRVEIVLASAGLESTHKSKAQSDGTFRVPSLPPGTYDATIRLYGRVQPLLTVNQIAVAPGETTVDPRLQDIELDALLRNMRFKIVDTAGKFIVDASALMVPEDTDHSRYSGVYVKAGKGDILITPAPISLFVWAEGYRATTIHDLRDEMTITLDSALQLRVQISAAVAELIGDYELHSQLAATESMFGTSGVRYELRGKHLHSTQTGGVPWSKQMRATIGDDQSATMSVLETGRYKLWFTVQSKSGGSKIKVDSSEFVVLVDRVGVQLHKSAVSAEAVQQAIDKLK